MTEPFLWVSRRAADAIARLEAAADRKLARLFVWTLAEMASERFDGKHAGFEATTADVMHRMDVSAPTFRKARDIVVKLGILQIVPRADRRGKRLASLWRLAPMPGEPPIEEAAPPEGEQLTFDLEQTDCPPYARAGEGDNNGNKSPSDSRADEPAPLALEVADDSPVDPVVDVIEHWRRVTPGRQGARVTAKRKTVVGARLKTFTVDDLKRVIDHKARDPFLNGQNKGGKLWNDLDVSLRNDEKVETALEEAKLAAEPGAAVGEPAPRNPREAQLSEKAKRAAARTAAMARIMERGGNG